MRPRRLLQLPFRLPSQPRKRAAPQHLPPTRLRLEERQQDAKIEKASLFEELFPNTVSTSTNKRPPIQQDDIFPSPAADTPIAAQPDVEEPIAPSTQEPTVLTLSSTTPSLLPSDFFRLAPQGQHLVGWAAGGITKIVQARHRQSLEPRGQYSLFFATRAAALAYRDEIRRLHRLAKLAVQLVPASSHKERGERFAAPLAMTSEEETAALQRWTLVAPSSRLDIVMHLGDGQAAAEVEQKEGLGWLFKGLEDGDGRTDMTARVLVSLEGTGMTIAGLRDVIEKDGVERNLPWRLLGGRTGILTVKWLVSQRNPNAKAIWYVNGDGKQARVPSQKKTTLTEKERLHRFIVSFTEPVEAHRFVRNWHRRTVQNVDTGRSMLMNATALW